MLTTALLLLTDAARFRPGDSVLVHGASGGIGSAVAQLVPALGGGLRIGTVGRPDSVTAALANGYDVAVRLDRGRAGGGPRGHQRRRGGHRARPAGHRPA